MRYGILVGVLLYELAIILGIGLWLRHRTARTPPAEGEFLLASRGLPLVLVSITLAKTVLGTAHILGQFEMAWHLGAVGIWFSIAHVIALVVVCQSTGLWVRRLRVTTVSEFLELLHGKSVRLSTSLVMAGILFGILTVESQGVGIIFAAMTGWDIKSGAVAGGTLGILVVVLAGMREIGWVNLVNAVVMYAGIILATAFLAWHLPGGDFSSVAHYYDAAGQHFMLSIYGTPELLGTFALSTTVSVVFCVSFSQGLLMPAMAADSEATVRRAMWIAAPLNGLFGVFAIVLGLTAQSIPRFQALGPKLAAITMLVETLPGWLSAVVLAAFLAAVLSTFAMLALAGATLLSTDFYRNLYRPQAGEEEISKVTRLLIVLMGGVAVGLSTTLPPIVPMMNWLFSWSIPIFFVAVSGLFWTRSATAAHITLAAAWLANSLWSFTPLAHLLHAPDLPNAYVSLAVTMVVGVLSNILIKGDVGYFQSEAYRMRTLDVE